MSDLFSIAMNKLTMFRPGNNSQRIADAISQITGIPMTTLAIAERSAISNRSFKPIRRLLENQSMSKVNKLKYRVGLKQAHKKSRRKGDILANKLEMTITTDRGAVHCEADIYVVCQDIGMGMTLQTVNFEIRYTIFQGLKKRQFKQNLKLTAREKAKTYHSAEWSLAA